MRFILRHRTKVSAVVLTILVVVWAVFAQPNESFRTEAAQNGMGEVAAGNLVLQKAQSERVKEFADQMVKNHSAVNEEMRSTASEKSGMLAAEVTTRRRSTCDRLNGLFGTEFGSVFMKAIVKDCQSAVKLFGRQSRDDADTEA